MYPSKDSHSSSIEERNSICKGPRLFEPAHHLTKQLSTQVSFFSQAELPTTGLLIFWSSQLICKEFRIVVWKRSYKASMNWIGATVQRTMETQQCKLLSTLRQMKNLLSTLCSWIQSCISGLASRKSTSRGIALWEIGKDASSTGIYAFCQKKFEIFPGKDGEMLSKK